jgi:uncharacterized lipoprotein YmbA
MSVVGRRFPRGSDEDNFSVVDRRFPRPLYEDNFSVVGRRFPRPLYEDNFSVVGRRFPRPACGERVRVRGIARRSARVALAATLLFLCACSLGTSPPERFFTLASEPASAAPASANTAAYLVVVGPVTIPEIVDRPQLVTSAGANRVEIAEQARWAAPLKSEIPRVIADHLARQLEGARTATSDERGAGAPDYRVIVDVQRFDSSPAGATIQASWAIRMKEGVAPLTGRSVVAEPAGAGFDALVAAHSRALARVSSEIADAIRASRLVTPR